MEKVERIQYQAALAITGTWSGSSRSKTYEELGWEFLFDRRTGRRVLQIHKIFNNKSPSYLKEKLPPNPRGLFSGIPRNTFREILGQSNRYMNSFFPDAISSWNIFIKHFNDIPSYDTLKIYQYLLSSQEQKYFWYSQSYRTTIPFSIESGYESVKES